MGREAGSGLRSPQVEDPGCQKSWHTGQKRKDLALSVYKLTPALYSGTSNSWLIASKHIFLACGFGLLM